MVNMDNLTHSKNRKIWQNQIHIYLLFDFSVSQQFNMGQCEKNTTSVKTSSYTDVVYITSSEEIKSSSPMTDNLWMI